MIAGTAVPLTQQAHQRAAMEFTVPPKRLAEKAANPINRGTDTPPRRLSTELRWRLGVTNVAFAMP